MILNAKSNTLPADKLHLISNSLDFFRLYCKFHSNMDEYRTITKIANGEVERKGSRFLAIAIPIKTQNEIKKYLSEVKAKYPRANHYPWGCRIFHPAEPIESYSDSGEPSGSAGLPILNEIKRAGLYSVLIVVARWFGGKKLGIAGLREAYSSAAQEAIKNSEIISSYNEEYLNLELPYARLGQLQHLASSGIFKIENAEYSEIVRATISFKSTLRPGVLKSVSDFLKKETRNI